ncbi:hypothetical protein HMPREF2531_02194 [Bacteroides intestinalis]|uniref:Uncharacterized protein n=2 Tax=Bacteroides TaxID=816 RepID=A0A139LIC5_9BACE|nr:hypothetical protein BACCELL_04668 [Bacteroides cellulosilyticus DSM 14838]KXT51197.1 hypothetical protein HMPREF2531_02194 [Bacteroides intestinalis]
MVSFFPISIVFNNRFNDSTNIECLLYLSMICCHLNEELIFYDY